MQGEHLVVTGLERDEIPSLAESRVQDVAGFDSVWVWDDEGSVVLRFAAGERES